MERVLITGGTGLVGKRLAGKLTEKGYEVAVFSRNALKDGPGNIYSFTEMTDMVNAATGLNVVFKDLMNIGEECLQLQRKLYVQFGGKDEAFLSYLEKEIPSGPSKGAKISEKDFNDTQKHYYSLWNW